MSEIDYKLTTAIKSLLLQKDWGEAITLLDFILRKNPEGFKRWVSTGSTIVLKEICEPFRKWSFYRDRLGPLPFENDVWALDAVITKAKAQL